ncbi:type II toxin-antitoxin system PemK/MazF family toxin [Aliivibrio sp. S3MY1]|uniref:type II toxin-antitoxin system PemK/MazF family toxin n=1 Tax=unclassified Aliivibrio TaxID=2645654 RepID=UPI002378EA42|nr:MULTISPECIES: type II toxin-antitoxin system PemK/MazF family toxin [unclassified Aliivibrio]MDD9197451.1 type II toxin-antitoxin system PemK/MazF family toxin [Aliivibrio sp. S3MY1]MDD9200702.1 type II toxin-antitoxin system PemK/MazF family toxin [Aliivibrio sp. S2MY1]
MAITYIPKVGDILECDFGNFKIIEQGYDERNYDGRIPNEMIKRRMVMVINPKVGGGCHLVVPISSTKNIASINNGTHVEITSDYFRVTNFYDKRERWAKCEALQLVSKYRLFKMIDNGERFEQKLPREMVELVQRGIIAAVNAKSLLK